MSWAAPELELERLRLASYAHLATRCWPSLSLLSLAAPLHSCRLLHLPTSIQRESNEDRPPASFVTGLARCSSVACESSGRRRGHLSIVCRADQPPDRSNRRIAKSLERAQSRHSQSLDNYKYNQEHHPELFDQHRNAIAQAGGLENAARLRRERAKRDGEVQLGKRQSQQGVVPLNDFL